MLVCVCVSVFLFFFWGGSFPPPPPHTPLPHPQTAKGTHPPITHLAVHADAQVPQHVLDRLLVPLQGGHRLGHLDLPPVHPTVQAAGQVLYIHRGVCMYRWVCVCVGGGVVCDVCESVCVCVGWRVGEEWRVGETPGPSCFASIHHEASRLVDA